MSKRSGCKLLGLAATLLMGATSAQAALTTVNAPWPGEDTHQVILETVYGADKTFTRVDDSSDQVWSGGIKSARALARFADQLQAFGVKVGGTTTKLFDVTGSAYAVAGSSAAMDLPGSYEFVRLGEGKKFSSVDAKNSDGMDHMVTYMVSGDGIKNKTYVLFWEDLAKNQKNADFDFEDMVVEVTKTAVIPLPAAAWSGLATLAMGGLFGGYRKLRRQA